MEMFLLDHLRDFLTKKLKILFDSKSMDWHTVINRVFEVCVKRIIELHSLDVEHFGEVKIYSE